MKNNTLLLFILILISTTTAFAQPTGIEKKMGGSITGLVFDAELDHPLEYANILLYTQKDSTYITGTITDKSGKFNLFGLRPGKYFAKATFIGYHDEQLDDISIKRDNKNIDLGKINLKQAALAVDGVDVVSERAPIEYQIDKKVINVSKQFTAASGSAAEVLENVPSVEVDMEGNVSLRGSGNFTVLIDNRPTVMDPSDVLQQIPASTIENIEIVTNPSAKYDPEGTSGIINIITKEKKKNGINGNITLNGGLNEKYGGDLLLNLQRKKFTVFFGGDYNLRNHPGEREGENKTFDGDTTSIVKSHGDHDRKRKTYGVKTGATINLTPKDFLSIEGRVGSRNMEMDSEVDYNQWENPGDEHTLYLNKSDNERSGNFYSATTDYTHNFTKQGHTLSGQANVSQRNGESESITQRLDMDNNITKGSKSTEDRTSDRFRFKLDYTLPLNEHDNFEAGIQSRIDNSEDSNEKEKYDPELGLYEIEPEFSHTAQYEWNVQGIYALYAGEVGSLGYQGGIRAEYTDRLITVSGQDQEYGIDRWDYFPTAHLSYKFSDATQLMASYTRRINRPRGWHLNPFETWWDTYNVRKGNPNLEPEYIDSSEFGFKTIFGKHSLSVEAYYRITDNKIERIRTVYDGNIFLHTTENVGQDYTLGSEIMLNLNPVKWWNINLMGNVYNYSVEGELYGQSFDKESSNWSLRGSNMFKLNSTRIQISGMYRSSSVTSQGEREAMIFLNAAIKQTFMDNKLTATLQVRDILQTGNWEFTSEGDDFYTYTKFTRDAPDIMLTLSYNFNNYKPDRRRQTNENGDDMEDDEMF